MSQNVTLSNLDQKYNFLKYLKEKGNNSTTALKSTYIISLFFLYIIVNQLGNPALSRLLYSYSCRLLDRFFLKTNFLHLTLFRLGYFCLMQMGEECFSPPTPPHPYDFALRDGGCDTCSQYNLELRWGGVIHVPSTTQS